jgi:hypothetical protein
MGGHVIIREWCIDLVTPDDASFIRRQEIEYVYDEPEYRTAALVGQNLQYCIKQGNIRLFTCTRQEETLLKLYFADRIILVNERVELKYGY